MLHRHEWDECKSSESGSVLAQVHWVQFVCSIPCLVHNRILKQLTWIISLRSGSPDYLENILSHTGQYNNLYPKHFGHCHGTSAVTIHNCAPTAARVNWGSFDPLTYEIRLFLCGTTFLSVPPVPILLSFRFSCPVPFSSWKAPLERFTWEKGKWGLLGQLEKIGVYICIIPSCYISPKLFRVHYRTAGRIITGMYWFDPRSPPAVTRLSAMPSRVQRADGRMDTAALGTSPGHCVAHKHGTACKHAAGQKSAPWESRSKQCDCISRLIQLIPEARVNSLIQCIIPVQAEPQAGIVSRGAPLQCAASATACPRAWRKTALLLSTSFWEMLCTSPDSQNSSCFRPLSTLTLSPRPALLDLWSTLLTFKDSQGQISSDLASISRADRILPTYPPSPLVNQCQLSMATPARQRVDGTIILTRTSKPRLLTHQVQYETAVRALSSSCPFSTATAELLCSWSLASCYGKRKNLYFQDIIL